MKFTLFIVVALCLASFTFAQNNLPDYSKLPSVVYPPPGFSPSPNGTNSVITTSSDGFDNFYLGTDFGEPHIATNPKDFRNSVTAYNINNFYYTLNGIDWVKKGVGFPNSSEIGDPVLAYDSLGNLYYLQMYQIGSLYGGWVTKSTNKGVDFMTAVSAYSFNGGLGDKPWICTDQTAGPYSNYVYVAWRQFGSTGMRFVRSTDQGESYSSPISFTGDQGAYVCVGANGNVSGGSVYLGCTSGSTIRVYRSTNGGASFGGQVTAVSGITGPGTVCSGRNTVKNCIRTDYFPRMSADNSFTSTRGNVYIVYAAKPGGGDLCNIYLVRSTDFGVTWSAPAKVNDDATLTDQWMPSIMVDNKSGKVFISWYDSRNDPTGNLLSEIWGTHSTDGGVTFAANYKYSNSQFNPNSMAVGQPGGENYIGDYFGISTVTSSTSSTSFMDARFGGLGSFVSYGPDFAMKTDQTQKYLNNNDSTFLTVTVPAVKGGFNERVKFVTSFDTLPGNGSLQVNFINGKDSITSTPDSVRIRVKTVGNVSPGVYKLNVIGSGINGIPTHRRTLELIVNSSYVKIGTNRNSIVDFQVNGTTYNALQNLLFANGSIVQVKALSPKIAGGSSYIFSNWSDGGDTTHNINVTSPITLTANYRVAFKLIVNSTVGNTFGGNVFYDSAATFTFGVNSRTFVYNGQTYFFKGWTGSGNGSYTSPDSTGIDSVITYSMSNAIVEIPRWQTTVGINNISSEIPNEWKLFQNYPNPFNPVTKINFDVFKSEFVNIKVYDILGKEVKNLFNENLQPGKYSVTFDASNLPSGIYFYKFTSNSFSDIKKMLLIK